jgi:hypothetical protein
MTDSSRVYVIVCQCVDWSFASLAYFNEADAQHACKMKQVEVACKSELEKAKGMFYDDKVEFVVKALRIGIPDSRTELEIVRGYNQEIQKLYNVK